MHLQRQSNLAVVIALILLNLIIYFNGIKNDFAWDDIYLVKDNYKIRDISNIKELLTMEDKPPIFYGRGYFRPFINLTYLFDYQIYKDKAYGFRLTNIIFHILSSIMLFMLILLITGNRPLSVAAAFIFSAQAVHVEAVTLISGRNNVICTFFILLTLYYYVKILKQKESSYFIYSLIFLFLGAASKEFAFMVPFIFILYDYCFLEDFSLKKGAKRYAAAFLPILLFMVYRVIVVPTKGAFTFNTPDKLYLRVINTFRVFVNYIRSQIFPDSLSIYFGIPLKKSFFTPQILASFLTLLLLTSLVIYFEKKSKERILFFSYFTYFLLLAPVSNIIEIPGSLMADRWIYPASAAFSLFLARLIFLALNKKKELIPIAVAAFVILLSIFTIKRNIVFKNDLNLFSDMLDMFPDSAMARNNLGSELDKRGYIKEAEEQYLLAIEYNPEYNLPYNNLGVIYGKKKEHEKALEYFKKAYEKNPRYALTAFNMAITYSDLGNMEESNKFYNIAIELSPEYFDAYYNLAASYYKQMKFEESLDVLRRALKISYTKEREEGIRNKIKLLIAAMNEQKELSSKKKSSE